MNICCAATDRVRPKPLQKTNDRSLSRGGTPLVAALEQRARVLELPPFDRFVAAVAAAQERGIPLADALRSLAFDLREHDKRELIEVAGRKQISMLVPVVMLILPVAPLTGGWRLANRAGGANVNHLMSSDPADVEALAGMSWLTGVPVEVERVDSAPMLQKVE